MKRFLKMAGPIAAVLSLAAAYLVARSNYDEVREEG